MFVSGAVASAGGGMVMVKVSEVYAGIFPLGVLPPLPVAVTVTVLGKGPVADELTLNPICLPFTASQPVSEAGFAVVPVLSKVTSESFELRVIATGLLLFALQPSTGSVVLSSTASQTFAVPVPPGALLTLFSTTAIVAGSGSAVIVSAMAAIAGMASSTAIVKKRSVTLLLRIVRISTCLPSQFPYTSYTSRSLCPFLSLSPLLIGGDFHVFYVGCLSCSDYRLPSRGGRALC